MSVVFMLIYKSKTAQKRHCDRNKNCRWAKIYKKCEMLHPNPKIRDETMSHYLVPKTLKKFFQTDAEVEVAKPRPRTRARLGTLKGKMVPFKCFNLSNKESCSKKGNCKWKKGKCYAKKSQKRRKRSALAKKSPK